MVFFIPQFVLFNPKVACLARILSLPSPAHLAVRHVAEIAHLTISASSQRQRAARYIGQHLISDFRGFPSLLTLLSNFEE